MQRESTFVSDVDLLSLHRSRGEGIRPKGQVIARQWRNGKLIAERIIDNLVVTAGKGALASRLVQDTPSPFTYVAVGTGTTAPAAGDTALEAEIVDSGLARTQDTTPEASGNVATISVTFNVTGAKAVTEAGLFNAAAGGDMFCRVTFAALNLEAGDTLTWTWQITIN